MPIARARRRQATTTLMAGLVLAGGVPAEATERQAAPCPASGRVTQEFGPAPSGFHYGLDIANAAGSPVKAGLAGKVSSSDSSGALGQFIVVTHPDATKTVYGHLRKRSVGVGTAVNGSTKIGEMGATGTSDGRARLHLEVIDRERVNPRLKYTCPR